MTDGGAWPSACLSPRCPELVYEDYCRKHRDQRYGGGDVSGDDTRASEDYDRRWEKARRYYLDQNPVCERCESRGYTEPAETVHHVIPLEAGGSKAAAWNLKSLCWPCHNRIHALMEDPRTTLVCGPPGAGKSTYVARHRRPGDLVLDVDNLWRALGNLGPYEYPDTLMDPVMRTRDYLLDYLANNTPESRAWVIATAADPQTRKRLHYRLQAHTVVLAVDRETCKERIRADERRDRQVTERHLRLVEEWWQNYEPIKEQETVRMGRVAGPEQGPNPAGEPSGP